MRIRWERFKVELRQVWHAVELQRSGALWTGALAIIGGGAMLTTSAALGWASIGVGFLLLLYSIRIHGMRLIQPWWRGPVRPDINAALLDFPYHEGTVINGIQWSPDYSHVSVRIANSSNEILEDLNFTVALDRPIIRSAFRSPLAECVIGPDPAPVSQVTAIGTDEQGNKVALVGDETQAIIIAPFHRFICPKLPRGAAIDIDIATVMMLEQPAPALWTKSNPSVIEFQGTYSVQGRTQSGMILFPLGSTT